MTFFQAYLVGVLSPVVIENFFFQTKTSCHLWLKRGGGGTLLTNHPI